MNLRLVLFLSAILAMSGLSRASVMVLDPKVERQPVASLEVFPSQSGSDAEIVNRLLTAEGRDVPNGQRLGSAFEDIWLRLTLKNPTDADLHRVLSLPNSYAAKAFEFYSYRDGALLEKRSFYQDKDLSEDMMRSRSAYAELLIPAGSRVVVIIKVASGYEQLSQNFQMTSRQEFLNWEVMSTFFVGIFLGILFLTVLANLMQAAAYRDRTFLWYSAYCASLLISSLSFYGVWARLFSLWNVQRYLASVAGMTTLVTGVMFMSLLLDTKSLASRLDKVFKGVAWVAVITFVLRLIPATSSIAFILQSVNSIAFVVLSIVAGVNAMLHGKELAWLYTSSCLFIALSVIYVRLSHINVLPMSPSAIYAPALGHIMQVILISYVMFIRSRRAHVEALRSQRNHSMNERLNLLLKIISHDIANPLQAISLYCNMALHKVKAEKLPEMELQKAQEAINTQTRIIKHAKEAVRQMQLGQKLQIQPVHVSQIMNEVLQIFQPLCQDRGIHLEVQNELKEDLVIFTDPTILVHNIMGNILSNSIKFTPEKGLIRILVRCHNRRLVFELVDNGPGISKEKRIEIFTLNVGKGFNEQLTGAGSFGLNILQMCSELLNGQLDIGPSSVSDAGQELGLRITVSLPLHHAL